MAWTKGDIVRRALEELAIAGYAFDVQPDELNTCLNRLDSMCAAWRDNGTDIGYNHATAPNSTLETDASGVVDSDVEAVSACLAIRIAPVFGKTPSAETKANAARGRRELRSKYFVMQTMKRPRTMPIGSGNKGTASGLNLRYFVEEFE